MPLLHNKMPLLRNKMNSLPGKMPLLRNKIKSGRGQRTEVVKPAILLSTRNAPSSKCHHLSA
jgi:hypothetical protein